jgi:hypothetical protein
MVVIKWLLSRNVKSDLMTSKKSMVFVGDYIK